jgi:hypothetical protein
MTGANSPLDHPPGTRPDDPGDLPGGNAPSKPGEKAQVIRQAQTGASTRPLFHLSNSARRNQEASRERGQRDPGMGERPAHRLSAVAGASRRAWWRNTKPLPGDGDQTGSWSVRTSPDLGRKHSRA